MDIDVYGALSSRIKKCVSIDINAGHSFTTTIQRDAFFVSNPTQLKANMYIYCNGQLQQYIENAWVDRSVAIQGAKGDKGDTGTNGTNGTNGINGVDGTDGVDGVGIQSVVDNGDNTFTITLTDNTSTVIDKIDTINSDVITQGSVNLFMTTTEQNKLNGIETGAEVNNISDVNVIDLTDNGDTTLHYHSSDRDRANHTGVQSISTITGLQTELDNKIDENFSLYNQKGSTTASDRLIINDSEDGNLTKYVTLNQIVSAVQDPHNKGYFTTGLALNTAIPTGIDGDFAVVGETNTIWVWASASSDFVNSGASGCVLSVNGETGVVTITKMSIGLENVVNLDTSTTVNITDSTDKRFVTDSGLVVIGNTSGTNTGDETNATIKTKLGTDLSNKVDKVSGKSLIADSEITRLSTVENYNDTAITERVVALEGSTGFSGNYEDLTNKPSIDGTTLVGEMDYSDFVKFMNTESDQTVNGIKNFVNGLLAGGIYANGTVPIPTDKGSGVTMGYSTAAAMHRLLAWTGSTYGKLGVGAYSGGKVSAEYNADGTVKFNFNITAPNIAYKSAASSYTLVTWSGSTAPYTITIPVTGATTTNIIEVVPNYDTITDTQLTALKSAQIDKITQTTGNITLYAYGTKPTVEIPIKTILRGDA